MRGLILGLVILLATASTAHADGWRRAYSKENWWAHGIFSKGIVTIHIGKVKRVAPNIFEFLALMDATQPFKSKLSPKFEALSYTRRLQIDCRSHNMRVFEETYWDLRMALGEVVQVMDENSSWQVPLHKLPDANRYQKADVEESKIIPRMVCRK